MNEKIIFTVDQDRVIAASMLGLTYVLTADFLDMNFHTYSGHLKIIYAKLGIHSMPELVAFAFLNGYIKP